MIFSLLPCGLSGGKAPYSVASATILAMRRVHRTGGFPYDPHNT